MDGGGARHIDSRGKVKVCRVPVCQGCGAVGHVAAVCEGPVVPLSGRPSHPTGGVEERYTAGFPILGDPGRRVPQEEGGRISLLAVGVDLLRYASRSERGGSVHRVNPIWVQNGLVVAGKHVGLWAGEIRTVRGNFRRQIRLAAKASHGLGPR